MLSLVQVEKSYGSKHIAKGISYQFPAGKRVSLVGPNGAGKSTLMKMIAGAETLDFGEISRPKDLRVGYLSQEVGQQRQATVLEECMSGAREVIQLRRDFEQISEDLATDHSEEMLKRYEQIEAQIRIYDAYSLESKAALILKGLGFDEQKCQGSPDLLSGGWKMRLELAKVLLSQPDFLLLDEPTNHLDLPSLLWFESFIEKYSGTVVLISHDRDLLNRFGQVTLFLNHGQLTEYPGNYDDFLRIKEERQVLLVQNKANLERKRAQLESFVDRFGAKASKAAQAQSKQKQIDRILEQESEIQIDGGLQAAHIRFRVDQRPGKEVLKLKDLSVGYDRKLYGPIEHSFMRGARLGIIGANGLGKSSLLKTIAGRIKAFDGNCEVGHNVKIAYFAQESADELNLQQSVLENVLNRSRLGEAEARSLLGSLLFNGDDVFKAARVLSGGERNRLSLAVILASDANVFLLDEPTNHLDMSAIDRLIDGIVHSDASFLIVSHNRYFLRKVTQETFAISSEGKWLHVPSGIEDFSRFAKMAGFADILSNDQGISAPSGKTNKKNSQSQGNELPTEQNQSRKTEQNRQRQAQRDLSAVEDKLQKEQTTKSDLEAQLIQCSPTDFKKLSELQSQLEATQERIAQHEQRWMALSAELDG